MTLVSKAKSTSHSKKRRGEHHRQTKLYLKPYWPYLPITAIILGGIEASQHLFKPGLINLASSQASARPLTRIDSLFPTHSDKASLILLYLTILAVVLLGIIYWRRLRKLLVLGEVFVIEHPFFDIGLVFIAVGGIVLTRTA